MDENKIEDIVTHVGGKKKLITIGVIILVVAVGGYLINGFIGRTAGDKMAENILENQLGGDVDIDSSDGSVSIKTDKGSFSSGDSAKWPSDMPSDVPKFTEGKIIMAGSSMMGGKGWQVVYGDVDKSDFENYHSLLKSNNWTDVGFFDSNVGIVQMSKDGNSLMIANNSQDKTFTLTVNISE